MRVNQALLALALSLSLAAARGESRTRYRWHHRFGWIYVGYAPARRSLP